MFFLLAQNGSRMALMKSENLQDMLDFARDTKVTGVIAEEYLSVDHSGEKPQPEDHINEAFRNLTQVNNTPKEQHHDKNN